MATTAQIEAAVIKRTSKFKADKEYVHAPQLAGQARMLQIVSQAAAAAAAAGH
jgi:hypothetical protein